VPQGDCLSPVLFTLYLANALKEEETPMPSHQQDHCYSKKNPAEFIIHQQYADDISFITNSREKAETIKATIPAQLKKRNLQVNINKTEQYSISRTGGEDWKKCKYLGSCLGTSEDINRRKQLAMGAFNQHKAIFESRRTSLPVKIRLFNAYVTSIFLYNSELWTLNIKDEENINIFQRKLLRKILQIKWPKTISNIELYNKTNEENWAEKIRKRRLKWLGHVLRQQSNTPARLALEEQQRPYARPKGKPKTTWLARMTKELNANGIKNIAEAEQKAANRDVWRALVLTSRGQTDRK
jgi:hypothetical protein